MCVYVYMYMCTCTCINERKLYKNRKSSTYTYCKRLSNCTTCCLSRVTCAGEGFEGLPRVSSLSQEKASKLKLSSFSSSWKIQGAMRMTGQQLGTSDTARSRLRQPANRLCTCFSTEIIYTTLVNFCEFMVQGFLLNWRSNQDSHSFYLVADPEISMDHKKPPP